MILLGISSAVLDLLRRQHQPFFDAKQALMHLTSVLPAVKNALTSGPEGPMKTRCRAIYHITVIALCTPLDDLERAANDGFSRTGRTSKQHTRAAVIRLLTRHKVEKKPAQHAVQLLKLYLTSVPTQETGNILGEPALSATSAPSPYEPSALYFGTLTLWAYITGQAGDDEDELSYSQGHAYLPDEDLNSPHTTSPLSLAETSIGTVLQGMEVAIENNAAAECRGYWNTIVQHVTAALSRRLNNNAQEYSQVVSSLSDNFTA